MSGIKLFFLIFILIKKSIEYYNLKYGRLIIYYYNEADCLNNYTDRVSYPINETEEITILNSEGFLKNYSFDFDFFSSSIIYTDGEEDEEDEENEDIYKRSIICNGLCYKRQNDSDIFVSSDTKLALFYDDYSKDRLYYSCIYNNIIQTAQINIITYEDAKCKSKSKSTNNEKFYGSDYCWKFNDSYSFRPLYFEDGDKKLYYHPYETNADCIALEEDFFMINENFLECNSKCHISRKDKNKSYKCTFDANKEQYIKQKLVLFLFLNLILLCF